MKNQQYSKFAKMLETKGRLEKFILEHNLRQEVAEVTNPHDYVIHMIIEAPNFTRIAVYFSDLLENIKDKKYETLTDLNNNFDETLYKGLKRALDEFDPITECEEYHMNVDDLTKEEFLENIRSDVKYFYKVLDKIKPKQLKKHEKVEQFYNDYDIEKHISQATVSVYKLAYDNPLNVKEVDLEDVVENSKYLTEDVYNKDDVVTYHIYDKENNELQAVLTDINSSEVVKFMENRIKSY